MSAHVHTFERSAVYCDGCGGYYDDVLPRDDVPARPARPVRASAASAVARYRARWS